ncbi:hypothetical protein [Hongsoonwoonella zoysiae]|uniref:hypothetical protein n=1 Tax=Hongsoonwoonella zoysiae TaxID=2821844 RepID=UPI001FEC560C|nr:hypothetical protein [Hongsoonwoonella zoysiae]
MAETDFTPAGADAPASPHSYGLVMERVLRLWRRLILTSRGCIELAGIGACEALMGPLIVVNRHKAVEPFVVPKEIEGYTLCCFALQRQMHTLVVCVLLRAVGLDALDPDAQVQSPYGKLAPFEQCRRIAKGMPLLLLAVEYSRFVLSRRSQIWRLFTTVLQTLNCRYDLVAHQRLQNFGQFVSLVLLQTIDELFFLLSDDAFEAAD